MNGNLTTRTIVVTGASRGIGKAVAMCLARAGARVIAVATREGGCDDTVAACRDAGSDGSLAFACDVSDPEQVDAFARKVRDACGTVDGLINNAGITRDGVFLRMPVEDLDAVLNVNLRGAFLTCKAFARLLMKSPCGRIVNVGSVVGLIGNAGQVNYAASKAGLVGMTKALAKELAGRQVTVNLVAPGFITTDMTADLPEKARETMLAQVPLGRMGAPDDVAGAVSFLCSDAAAYITGQILVVDGGMTM